MKSTATASFVFVFVLALLIVPEDTHAGYADPRRLTGHDPAQHFSRFVARAAAARRVHLASGRGKYYRRLGRVFNPVDYGADPTGVNDSSDALTRTVAASFAAASTYGPQLLLHVGDNRGTIVDLGGGNYTVGRAISFPSGGGGDVVIEGGSIVASQEFPSNAYLVQLDAPPPPPSSENPGIRFEDVTFRDVLFHASLRGGGLHIANSARMRIVNCYFLGFTSDGLLVEGGHETFVSNTFFGQLETVGGDPRESSFSGTAINLASNDNVITDVAIFSAATGVLLRGQANILTGVHCYNKATAFGGVGVYIRLPGLSQTRIVNCYMDFTSIVMEDPVQVSVSGTFFLGDANVRIRSINGEISGLTIVDNMFAGSGQGTPIVETDESGAPFTTVEQAVIDRNSVHKMAVKGTVAERAVAGHGTVWTADFRSELVFENMIRHVHYSLYVRNNGGSTAPPPSHAVTGVGNNTVEVTASQAVDAVVSVAVDQYLGPEEIDLYGPRRRRGSSSTSINGN